MAASKSTTKRLPRQPRVKRAAAPPKERTLFRSWGTLKVEGQRQHVDTGVGRELELHNLGDPLYVERDGGGFEELQHGQSTIVSGATLHSPGRSRVRVSEYRLAA